MLTHYLYASRAARAMTPESLAAILLRARTNNAAARKTVADSNAHAI